MKRNNNLSNNLRALQKARRVTQSEFAQALDMPKSTLQAVMLDGNTTLDTLIHLADALGVSLDELVFAEDLPERDGVVHWLLDGVRWYADQPADRQEQLRFHIEGILKILTRDGVWHTVNDVGQKYGGDT